MLNLILKNRSSWDRHKMLYTHENHFIPSIIFNTTPSHDQKSLNAFSPPQKLKTCATRSPTPKNTIKTFFQPHEISSLDFHFHVCLRLPVLMSLFVVIIVIACEYREFAIFFYFVAVHYRSISRQLVCLVCSFFWSKSAGIMKSTCE